MPSLSFRSSPPPPSLSLSLSYFQASRMVYILWRVAGAISVQVARWTDLCTLINPTAVLCRDSAIYIYIYISFIYICAYVTSGELLCLTSVPINRALNYKRNACTQAWRDSFTRFKSFQRILWNSLAGKTDGCGAEWMCYGERFLKELVLTWLVLGGVELFRIPTKASICGLERLYNKDCPESNRKIKKWNCDINISW